MTTVIGFKYTAGTIIANYDQLFKNENKKNDEEKKFSYSETC